MEERREGLKVLEGKVLIVETRMKGVEDGLKDNQKEQRETNKQVSKLNGTVSKMDGKLDILVSTSSTMAKDHDTVVKTKQKVNWILGIMVGIIGGIAGFFWTIFTNPKAAALAIKKILTIGAL